MGDVLNPRHAEYWIGYPFGRLVVEDVAYVRLASNGRNRAVAHCRCACDNRLIRVWMNALRTGRTASCGCLKRARARGNQHAVRHGHVRGKRETRTHGIWRTMKTRCGNPNAVDYRWYGGRGITVCDRWRGDYANFLADMGEAPPGRTLDRIDNDGNYEPGNCRWATPKEQANNRRPRGTAS